MKMHFDQTTMIENFGEQEETEFLVLILICQRSKTQGTYGFFAKGFRLDTGEPSN